MQRNAMRAHEGEGRFRDLVEADPDITAGLSPEALAEPSTRPPTCAHVETNIFRPRLRPLTV